jgi:hypothetical protein
MDPDTLRLRLDQVEKQVACGAEVIGRQEGIIAAHEREGQDPSRAWDLLNKFYTHHAMLIQIRNGLLDEGEETRP